MFSYFFFSGTNSSSLQHLSREGRPSDWTFPPVTCSTSGGSYGKCDGSVIDFFLFFYCKNVWGFELAWPNAEASSVNAVAKCPLLVCKHLQVGKHSEGLTYYSFSMGLWVLARENGRDWLGKVFFMHQSLTDILLHIPAYFGLWQTFPRVHVTVGSGRK